MNLSEEMEDYGDEICIKKLKKNIANYNGFQKDF